MLYVCTCFVVKPRETMIRLRVQVAPEDAEAHSGLIVCLVGIQFGVLVPGLSCNSIVCFWASARQAAQSGRGGQWDRGASRRAVQAGGRARRTARRREASDADAPAGEQV